MKHRAGGILIVLMLTAILLLLVSTTVVFTQEYTGYIYVESEPSGAEVYLDGDYVGTTSIEFPVSPGEHEIKCVKSGYYDYYDDVWVEAGETKDVWCELDPVCYIYVKSEPSGADVYLDGDYVGTTSIGFPVSPGEHEIKCVKSGYEDYYKDVRVEAGETKDVWCELDPVCYIYVKSEPSGADVYLDGDPKGATPIEFPVSCGEHEIKCAKSGYRDCYKDVRVEAGETKEVWCELEPIPEEEGYIKVESEPSGADVYLDGDYEGRTPIALPVSPGEHEIKCAKSGYNDYYDDMRVEAGEPKEVWCELEPIPEEEGYIKVESEPSGADVYLDWEYVV
jgi:hypothetical protein